jgi:hypothetical protein
MIMKEFCVTCAEKEAQLEILNQKYEREMQCMREQLHKAKSENEALSLDVAFYGGNITNLSCNGK